jgi:hypothetical protein
MLPNRIVSFSVLAACRELMKTKFGPFLTLKFQPSLPENSEVATIFVSTSDPAKIQYCIAGVSVKRCMSQTPWAQ